jgi:hypothetical protein
MMATPQQIELTVKSIDGQTSFLQDLLAVRLGWPIGDEVKKFEEITVDWSGEELRAPDLDRRLKASQVLPIRAGQPWGIFLLEFADGRVYRSALRQVLRGLVPSRQHNPHTPSWHHENLLFLCTTPQYDQFTFAHFRGDKPQTAKLTTFGWQKGDSHLRTVCEFNLPSLQWPEDDTQSGPWLKAWSRAFDKEPLTVDFFRRFDKVVGEVQKDLQTFQKFTNAEAYSRAQLLLERLVFLYFLQNRGWLNQKRDYLPSHFQPYRNSPEEFSYYEQFLDKLFWSLASPPGPANRLSGIPFLNGGLFDDDEFAPTENRKRQHPPLKVRNATLALVFDELLEAFNFTVREDTPLDQDVAVDPEMLGKVFESIVLHAEAADPDAVAPDKRKATGSYYTPRIVVHFICHEVLQQFLQRHLPGENWGPRLKSFLEMDATQGLSGDQIQKLRRLLTPQEGKLVKERLRDLKCCDPAVGSGAFPVGLLHELVNLRRIVETAVNGYVDPTRKQGNAWLHEVKEEIVQNCLFGVDIQQQAIEICRLRLWLSLVVDYDLGIDPFRAERAQFIQAIEHISQLPNLDMNFHRGDSLLDMISGVRVRIETGALGFLRKEVKDLQDLSQKLHRATRSENKKKLRLEILRRRLDLTERVLNEQLTKLEEKDGVLAAVLFGEEVSDREKRRRLAEEMDQMREALARVQADRKELEKLAQRTLDKDFYPKLRKLEGADFDSPFNFAWRLDFAPVFTRSEPGFDIIVGNPPFVTARNPVKRELYRERWKRVCAGKYLLLCPFLDLSFGLLRLGGQLGFIVSNAFAKREYGKPLIEDFFPTVDLAKVIDCSGLLFPGHGTPTCLLFGSNQKPVPHVPVRVAALLPGGGDLRTPPEDSPLWHTLAQHHDDPGFADSRVVVADRSRKDMEKWPWNFDADSVPTKQFIETAIRQRIREFLGADVGFDAISAANDIFYLNGDHLRRAGVPIQFVKHLLVGEMLRNFEADQTAYTLWPYVGKDAKPKLDSCLDRVLSPFRSYLEVRFQFRKTQLEAGLQWFEFREYHRRALRPQLTYADIATHLHFIVSGGNRVFNQHAPVVELPPDSSDNQQHLLAGLLNSSSVLFWLKQDCYNKGAGKDEERDRFEYAGGKIEQIPIPEVIGAGLKGETRLTERLSCLSLECWERGQKLQSLRMMKVFEKPGEAYEAWNTALPGYLAPSSAIGIPFTNTMDLKAAVKRVTKEREKLRAEMIARQEEMDWLVYSAYGLIDAPISSSLLDSDLSLDREQRPFCLWAKAEGDFAKAVSLIPPEWSAVRKALWKSRLEAIRDNEHIRRIEQPVYKRRWDEQWKISNRWECGQPAYDAEFLDAFHWWLSEKAEWWLKHPKKGGPVSLEDWTAALWADSRVQAAWPVAAEATHRLEQWKAQLQEKAPSKSSPLDPGRGAFARFFKALVKEQTVPENIPFAVPWEQIEETVRVPSAVKRIRGKLNVPRERFWLTANGEYRVVQPFPRD